MIPALRELKDDVLKSLSITLHPYLPILVDKEKYTTKEADLWFKFMELCYSTPKLAMLAVQTICEAWQKVNQHNKKTSMPDRYLLLPAPAIGYGFAFGYTDNMVLEWTHTLYAIDLDNWAVVVKDKNGNILKFPISWLSENYLVSLIATLRAITTETIKTSKTI